MPEPTFHICTIVNNRPQYDAMRRSFEEAGFVEGRCRYTILDNTGGNVHEPYRALNAALTEGPEPYLLFCHQDLLADRGAGFDDLARALAELERRDPKWAVAGNAGGTAVHDVVSRLRDAHGDWNFGRFPHPVLNLDENFLIVRRGTGAVCSPGLSGFHLYGTDLCLNALRAGRTCYVLDFPLTHLSGGNPSSDAFFAALDALKAHWRPAFRFFWVRTPCTVFFLSRYRALERLFTNPKLAALVTEHPRIYGRLIALLTRAPGPLPKTTK